MHQLLAHGRAQRSINLRVKLVRPFLAASTSSVFGRCKLNCLWPVDRHNGQHTFNKWMTSLKIGNGSVELSYMRGSEKGSDVISKLATGSAQKQPFFKTCSNEFRLSYSTCRWQKVITRNKGILDRAQFSSLRGLTGALALMSFLVVCKYFLYNGNELALIHRRRRRHLRYYYPQHYDKYAAVAQRDDSEGWSYSLKGEQPKSLISARWWATWGLLKKILRDRQSKSFSSVICGGTIIIKEERVSYLHFAPISLPFASHVHHP